MAGRSRANLTHRQTDDLRAKFAAMSRDLPNRLKDHISGKQKLDSGQLKAIDMVLSRVLPTLQSVEQHVHTNPHAGLSEAQLRDKLAQLIAKNPAILKALAAEQERLAEQERRTIEGETVDLAALTHLTPRQENAQPDQAVEGP